MDYKLRLNIIDLLKIPLVAGIAYAVWITRDFLLLLLLSLVISTFIEDFVIRAKKYKIPRIVSVLFSYLIIVVLIFGILFFFIPLFGKEFVELIEHSPILAEAINGGSVFFDNIVKISNFSNAVDVIRNIPLNTEALRFILSIFGGAVNLVMVFVISFYLSVNEGIFKKLLMLVSPRKKQADVIRVWGNIQKKIGSWFRGQLIIAFLVLIFTYIGLLLLGVPYAFLLSLLAGVFGLIPYGIFIALIPAISLAIAHGDWYSGVFVILLYMGIQQLLDYILQPIILKRMTGIPSLLVILSVLFGAKLFGFIGVLIAVPLSLTLIELVAENQKARGINILEEEITDVDNKK